MLIRSQVITLLKGRYDSRSSFFKMPYEVIRHMKYSQTPDQEFLGALKDVADGKLEELRVKLEKDPRLVLQAGDVVTPAGLQVQDTTLLECAIGAGEDKEMIEMIKSYFDLLPGGEEAMESQIERYRLCIEAMQTQKPDDLTWLIEIVIKSSLADVAAELATGADYDMTYESPLRDALNQFREEKLAPKHRVINKPRMHCNYQNLTHAFNILDSAWNNLKKGNNYDRIYLVERQIIGFIELVELPAYERYVFAQGQAEAVIAGSGIQRSLKYKYGGEGEFPSYDASLVVGHSGVGFDCFVSIWGAVGAWVTGASWLVQAYESYVEQKLQACRTYAATPAISTARVCNSLT
jgi:hypothetical protein